MDSIRETLLRALAQYRGDDYTRAQKAFRGMSYSELQQQYGASGKTRQQILDEYKAHWDACDKALAFVNEI